MNVIEIKVDSAKRESLARAGFKLPAIYNGFLDRTSKFEGPLYVQGNAIYGSRLNVGAFCSIADAKLGNVSFGRYCAVAGNVAIGMHEHPTDWLTISRISHVPEMHDWQNILSRSVPERSNFKGTPFSRSSPETEIGNDVWIGYGAYIRAGVKIGNGAIIAAHSVVTKDVPAYSIAAGVPAKVVKMRFSNEIIDLSERVQWWSYCLLDVPSDLSDTKATLEKIDQLAREGRISLYFGETLTPNMIMSHHDKGMKNSTS
jgi:acetyltransferase-like isoleucine patch superfamily enzyme